MEVLLSLCLGLGLSAACGFRVFVPLLIMGLAAHTGHIQLAESFTWMASTPALLAFGVATILEIGAYYIPWLDNLLDTVAVPAAVVAGIIVTASCITDMDPWFRWTLAAIGGGGSAGVVQVGTSVLRGASSVTTGGLANPLVSTAEAGGAMGLSLLSVALPLLAVIAVFAGFAALLVLMRKRRRRTQVQQT